jgi:hypothetical protein
MNIEEKKKRKKKKKSKTNNNNLWNNIRARRASGKRPHRPGEKGYPDAKPWKKLTSESLLREVVQKTLVDLIKKDPMYSEEDPEFITRDPKHAEWLKSLADEYEEEFPEEELPPGEVPVNVDETSGGQDRPLSNIR